MLGTRTKQVISYGRRNQRVVVADEKERKQSSSIFDDLPPPQWAPMVSKMKKRENAVVAKPTSPTFVVMKRKKKLSPALSPKNAKRRAKVIDEPAKETPVVLKAALLPRAPLSPYPVNLLGSPAVIAKSKKKPAIASSLGKPSILKNLNAPPIDIDITVLDQEGRAISKERRVSQPIARPPDRRASKSKPPPVELSSDSEVERPIRPLKSRRARVVRIVSDDESSEPEVEPPELSPCRPGSSRAPSPSPPRHRPSHRDLPRESTANIPLHSVERFTPPRQQSHSAWPQKVISPPSQTDLDFYEASPVAKVRPLTPIRNKRGLRLFDPPSPPSPSGLSDFDLSAEFESLNIGDFSDPSSAAIEPPRLDHPEYLIPLLKECGQEEVGPYEFSAFIEAFPLDPVVRTKSDNVRFEKIGEASYSEVFGIGDVVLKIIPLRDERVLPGAGAEEVDGPPPSDAADVLKEIIVTRAMGNVSPGFVELLKTYVVRGRYPELLLDLWDTYLARNGSESVRPDTFLVSQIYAIIVLPNGGPDLEAYSFRNPTRTGWRQASSIFWQVAKTLGHAEQLVSFEHRDLHWGQILVKDTSTPQYAVPLSSRNLNQKPKAKATSRKPMDDEAHGVSVTLIDLGLSRMDAGDGHGGEIVHWTHFDEEIFMGQGDYQFEIYRLMRDHNGDRWEDFRPLTNVLWLHYLLLKLMKSKKLKAPVIRKDKCSSSLSTPHPTTAAEFTERECYEIMIELEGYLAKSVSTVASIPKAAKGKGRRKTMAPQIAPELPGPSCAAELIEYGVKQGWVKPIR